MRLNCIFKLRNSVKYRSLNSRSEENDNSIIIFNFASGVVNWINIIIGKSVYSFININKVKNRNYATFNCFFNERDVSLSIMKPMHTKQRKFLSCWFLCDERKTFGSNILEANHTWANSRYRASGSVSETHLERRLKALALDALDCLIFKLRAQMLRVAAMGQKYTWNRAIVKHTTLSFMHARLRAESERWKFSPIVEKAPIY